jgi:hypothetical protein
VSDITISVQQERLTKLEFVKLQVMVQKQAWSYLGKKDNCLSDAMTDLSPIFGSQVSGLPQNHDVVKSQCRKRYKNFRKANNMTQLSLVTW